MSGATITPFPRDRIVRLAPLPQHAGRLVPEPTREPPPARAAPIVILAEDDDAAASDAALTRERRRLIGRRVICLVTGWRGYVTDCRRRLGVLEAKFWTQAALGAPQRAAWVAANRLAPHPGSAA
ncbi:MAG TPA: hypothetical protein VMB81_08580 [Candidatus Sulfotelmatobacter sp.]|nr:hypothetical protein [Candidatus Sulfotelmatobacter sp.]